jgi:hypothetical protein
MVETISETRRRWENNIAMDPKETGYEGLDWIRRTENTPQLLAYVNTVMDIWIPWKLEIFFSVDRL